MATVSYKDAGVDIDAGNQFVENIKPYVKSTRIPGVLGGIGSFAGAFELPSGYKQPVILAGTDGVGTKLKLAIDAKKFDTDGIDLVAMCTNDLLCNFGEPLFFLDYYAFFGFGWVGQDPHWGIYFSFWEGYFFLRRGGYFFSKRIFLFRNGRLFFWKTVGEIFLFGKIVFIF